MAQNKTKSEVAVVILNYNGKQYLEEFIPYLVSYTPDADLIVADNNSSDDSLAFLQEKHPEIKTIRISENLGFAGGYNYALKGIDHEYFMILNSDVEVTPDWLTPLCQFLKSHPDHAAVQPKIKDQKNRSSFEYAGAAGGFIDSYGFPYCRGRIFDIIEEDHGQYDSSISVDWVSGACMLIRKSAFEEVGGFDESFFAHMEEIDMCWRLRNRGYKLAMIPESTVYHVGGGTLPKSNTRKTYLNFRNSLITLMKNTPGPYWWKIVFRFFMDGMASLKFLMDHGPGHFISIMNAYIHFLAKLPALIRYRKRQKPAKGSEKRYSIVYARYLQGKKYFSELD